MNLTKAALQKEVIYKASRSGGKGGQNVNKVSTKVELLFDINASTSLTDEDKAFLISKLESRFNKDGFVQVISEEERSQLLNKERALDKLYDLLVKGLHRPKIRRPTKVSKAVKARRFEQKRMQSVKKQLRQGGSANHD